MMDNAYVTEPALVPDIFATGIMPLEVANGCVRVTYIAERTVGLAGSIITEHLVVARLIIPEPCLVRIAHTARLSYAPLADSALLNG